MPYDTSTVEKGKMGMVYGYKTEQKELINSQRFDFHVLAVYLPIIVSISMRDGED